MKSPQPNSPMKKFSVLLLLTCLAFLGCQAFPLGLSEAQWRALSPEQQADYQRKQTAIDERRLGALRTDAPYPQRPNARALEP